VSILLAAFSVCKGPGIFSTLKLFFQLVFNYLWVKAHFLKETIDHIFPTMPSVSETMSMTVFMVMSMVVLLLMLSFWLFLLSFFWQNCYHHSWSAISFLNL